MSEKSNDAELFYQILDSVKDLQTYGLIITGIMALGMVALWMRVNGLHEKFNLVLGEVSKSLKDLKEEAIRHDGKADRILLHIEDKNKGS